MQTTSWYDYPQYYDLAFRDETAREVRFLQGVYERYACRRVRSVLEPGCGTGRLVLAMARRGYQLWAFDNNPTALDYARRRLHRARQKASLFLADLARFRLPGKVDAAYCLMNTFRHLLTERQALQHLQRVADCVRPGGIYVLGFHLVPPDAEETCLERWTAARGRLKVHYTLRVIRCNRQLRREWLRVCLLVRAGNRVHRLRHEFPLRLYTASQFQNLLRRVPAWQLCDTFDFWYELDEPVPLDDQLNDAVFVLRRV
jgi:SAM-dependent methyltransferase